MIKLTIFLFVVITFGFVIVKTAKADSAIAAKGDANGDGVINILDFNLVVSCFGNKANTPSCPNKSGADVNKDGVVDGIDYTIVIKYFGLALPVTPTPTPSFDSDLQSIDSSLNQLDSDLNSVDTVLTPTP